MLAQSVGGGGGNAASSFSKNFNDKGQLSIDFGRLGGKGGIGGDVDATLGGSVTTSGEGSYGLLAQSIGGGGGTSSTTVVSLEGDRSTTTDSGEKAKSSADVELAFGLDGGQGSKSGNVTVTASATVNTSGKDAHGIFAQSIGGGGGAGGAAVIDKFQELALPDFSPAIQTRNPTASPCSSAARAAREPNWASFRLTIPARSRRPATARRRSAPNRSAAAAVTAAWLTMSTHPAM